MAREFEVGDRVRLKSGGPPITVAGIDETDTHGVRRQWLQDDGKPESRYFRPTALKPSPR